MLEMLIASGVVLLVGVLVLWWASACRRGTLPRNWIFGYRTLLTLRDSSAWVAVNRASAPFITIAGGGLIVGAILGVILSLFDATEEVPLLVGSSIVWLVAWTLVGIVPAIRAERTYRQHLDKE